MRAALERLGLLAEEAGAGDQLLDFFQRRGRHRGDVGNFLEQNRSDPVNSLVGALRGENRRHQAFPGVAEIQTDARLRIEFGERRRDSSGASAQVGFACVFGHFRLSGSL